MEELKQRFEMKMTREKKKFQDIEMELRVEKQRSSQLTTKLEEFKVITK